MKNSELDRFTALTDELLRVPHREIKAKLDAMGWSSIKEFSHKRNSHTLSRSLME
jgi:hypothetical protein